MRTTINLDDDLLAHAKAQASRSGKTLTAFVEDALRERLARQTAGGPTGRVILPTFMGKGLLPGVDLDNSAGLLDVMDGLA